MTDQTLPRAFNLAKVKRALDGRRASSPYALRQAFIWAGTPQGRPFWMGEYDSTRKGHPLSDEARTALETWVSIAEQADKEATT